MLPIRDHNPSEQTPYVTYALIGINLVVFASYWPLFNDPRALAAYFDTWGLVPVDAWGEQYTFITSMFLHGGLMHIAGNMLFLFIFGDNLEEEMGHLGYLLFYLAGGLGAALFQVLTDPASPVPMVGASGAIAGVMGGYLLLFPKARIDIFIFFIFIIRILPVPAWLMLGIWFGLQLFSGLNAAEGTGGVAYWAHAGGFIVGFALTIPVWLRRGGPGYWRRTEGHPPHPEARYRTVRSRIPKVRR
jgi:membrane associated rhomboid family serine protease